jgi:protocatechuate 3,4-dioxygenase beta subunit
MNRVSLWSLPAKSLRRTVARPFRASRSMRTTPDVQGYYGENHSEYPPRLFGWMKTDASGRFELRTNRPSSYPRMQVPAHIHFTLWGEGYPLQWVEELRFEGDPYITSSLLAEDAQRGEFRSIQRVTHGNGGVLHCSLKIRVQTETNFH